MGRVSVFQGEKVPEIRCTAIYIETTPLHCTLKHGLDSFVLCVFITIKKRNKNLPLFVLKLLLSDPQVALVTSAYHGLLGCARPNSRNLRRC